MAMEVRSQVRITAGMDGREAMLHGEFHNQPLVVLSVG